MPYISTEALVGGALLVVLALGYQYIPTADANNGGGSSSSSAKKHKKKNKKKNTNKGDESSVAATPVLSAAESDVNEKGKKKKKGKTAGANVQPTSAAPPAQPPTPSAPSPSTSPEPPSFAAAASQPPPSQQTKPKLLAEKLLPKPRKTKVDDMLEPEDRAPQIARVMKIKSGNASSSSAGFSASEKVPKFEDDYAESTSDSVTDGPQSEDEWSVVSSKKKPMSLNIGGGSSYSHTSHSSSDSLTKIQRKNQKKAEAKKAQKAADEADRLRRLAMHKRDLERQRIDEIYKQNKVIKQGGKVVSGGTTAQLSETGKLVWD